VGRIQKVSPERRPLFIVEYGKAMLREHGIQLGEHHSTRRVDLDPIGAPATSRSPQ
jgi:hypothetical protein